MPLKMARKDKDTFSGGEKNGTRVWELWLVDARRGTWGHQVWDAETCGTGTRDVKYRDAGDAGCEWLLRFQSLSSWICFGEGSPPYPSYGSSMPVYEAKTRRRPPSLKKVKPLSLVSLVFLLMEYWSPKQCRVSCGRHSIPNKKKETKNPEVLAPKSIAYTTTPRGV